MPNIDLSAQAVVHSLEQGRLAPVIKTLAFTAIVIALSVIYIVIQFRGLTHPDAMDQAQIARSLAQGEGFVTKYIRPLAIWQLEQSGKEIPDDGFPDFTHQPLMPFLNAGPFWLAGEALKMTPLDVVAPGDRLVVVTSTLFFLLSALVWFFVCRDLFDIKLAGFCLAAMLLTDLFWQFSISGLPQMLALFLFSLATWFTVRAIGEGVPSRRRAWLNLPAAALCFGLMVLTLGLTLWIFAGWILFMAFFFRRQWITVLLAVVVFAVVVSPWLVRNYVVSGNPFGLNIYTILQGETTPEMGVMRELTPDLRAAGRGLRGKIKDGVITQASSLLAFLGVNILAVAFFVSLVHRFKSSAASIFRWLVLIMWLTAAVGMALFGLPPDPVSTNQLHVLFLPLFIFFGAAFLMVLWNRLHIESYIFGKAYTGGLLFLVAIPMITTIFLTRPPRIEWPPYVPPFIAVLSNWFEEGEILASDMPWAVAWYADRKTVLLPQSPRILTRMHDYRVLGGPIAGLYLTPITGNQPLVSHIYKGPYREWARLITRPPDMQGFFLQSSTPLPLDGECIIFADFERWLRR